MWDALGRVAYGPLRALDISLKPVMFILGGFRSDSLQETHAWHRRHIRGFDLDSRRTVWVEGDDPSTVVNRVWPFPLFHAPVLGGWTRYTVLRVKSDPSCWHVGWIHHEVPTGSRKKSGINALTLNDREVRVLRQPKGFLTQFFAIDSYGDQLPLKHVADGVLGDGRFPGIRLL